MSLHKQGFTLMELLIGILATTILVLTVSLILLMPYRSMDTNNEYARLRRDMAYAVRMMAKEIRLASVNDITATENLLTLPPNLIRTTSTDFVADPTSGMLSYADDSGGAGTLISTGLRRFVPAVINDPANNMEGVELALEMEGNDGETVVAWKTFIHTRN